MEWCWKNHAAVEIPEIPDVPTDEARREAARVAAEEARAATARCDEECDAAEERASEAEAAAVRCVKARDNAAAAMAARKAVAGQARKTALSAEVKADAVHGKERSAAAAAALAARQASVRCAAACHDAIAAALADREASNLCVPVIEDSAIEEARAAAAGLALQRVDAVAAAARQAAAGLAVHRADAAALPARQAAADVVVIRADAAALAARQAAASCDEALADPEAEDDKKFLDSMRGWLMTVAALLANMTFTAIVKPPSWVPMDFGLSNAFSGNAVSGASSPAAAPSPGAAKHTVWYMQNDRMAIVYLLVNVLTFVNAILLLVMLLQMGKGAPAKTLTAIRFWMKVLATFVVFSFASATSSDLRVVGMVAGFLVLYASVGRFIVWIDPMLPTPAPKPVFRIPVLYKKQLCEIRYIVRSENK